MKKHEHQYVTGMITGGVVAMLVTLLSYATVISVQKGMSVSTLLVLVSCVGMLFGAAMSYLVSRAEEGPHFTLRR